MRSVAWLIAAVSLGRSAAAQACDCPERELRAAVRAAEVVALVTLSEVRRAGDGTLRAKAVFEDVLRGPAPGSARVVQWGTPSEGRCPPSKLSPGRWWVLGRVEQDGRLAVSRCDEKTRVVSAVEVRARRAELARQLPPVTSAEEARVVAAAVLRPLLRAALRVAPGASALSPAELDSVELAPPERAMVEAPERGRWVVRWRHHPRAGFAVDAEVHVRADGTAQALRAEADFAPD